MNEKELMIKLMSEKKWVIKRIIAYALLLIFIYTSFIFMSLYLVTQQKYYIMSDINNGLINHILYYIPQTDNALN
ncbi:MAG TPA: hypothetical protein PKU95_01895 [Candidatus Dojkabacteria bacterium]|nr:hypothetical protein [Candidatus Dojkabacteria bacterium]